MHRVATAKLYTSGEAALSCCPCWDASRRVVRVFSWNAPGAFKVDWLEEDVLVLARLAAPLDLRLERHAPARFIFILFGPQGRSGAGHFRHLEVGEAMACLMQDEEVVAAAYTASEPRELIEAIDLKMHKLTVMPHVHRPTTGGVERRIQQLRAEMAAVTGVGHHQMDKWDQLAGASFADGCSLKNTLQFLVKYAIPLISGIALALVLKNSEPDWYNTAFGKGSYDKPEYSGGGASNSTTAGANSSTETTPTLFGFEIEGHPVGMYFIVNDVLLCFHFGLAAEEVTESFLPGAILYPPSKAAVNPLVATLAGTVVPVVFYFLLLWLFDSVGAFDDREYSYNDLANGWAIPATTDISVGWAAALMVFGRGHPAINYLLLLSIIDEALGVLIIAVFYTDRDKPIRLEYLPLVLAAMAMAFAMRRLGVLEWVTYVFVAGPVAWCGLLFARVHPAIALAFVVPFMPVNNDAIWGEHRDGDDGSGDKLLPAEPVDNKDEDSGEKEHGEERGAAKEGRSTLFEYERATVMFVDVGVLFLFGLVNAGVSLDKFGPYTAVVALSAVFGKTLGIGCAALAMHCCGFPLPAGLKPRSMFMVGFIGSVVLTVSLFISGEAFGSDGKQAESEAKLGALMTLWTAVLAVAFSRLTGGACKQLAELDDTADQDSAETIGESNNDNEMYEEHDEFLEHVFAINCVDQLRKMHKHIQAVEADTQITRRQAYEHYHAQLHERELDSQREAMREKKIIQQFGVHSPEIHGEEAWHGPVHIHDEQHRRAPFTLSPVHEGKGSKSDDVGGSSDASRSTYMSEV